MHSILGAYAVHAVLQRKKSDDRASIIRDLCFSLEMAIDKTPADVAEEMVTPTLVVIRKLKEQADGWENGNALGPFDFSEALKSVSNEIVQVITTLGEIFTNH